MMQFLILNCSYKEHSDATTDEDDVITAADSKVPDIPDDAETIEKVLTHRYGKPGGIILADIKFYTVIYILVVFFCLLQ